MHQFGDFRRAVCTVVKEVFALGEEFHLVRLQHLEPRLERQLGDVEPCAEGFRRVGHFFACLFFVIIVEAVVLEGHAADGEVAHCGGRKRRSRQRARVESSENASMAASVHVAGSSNERTTFQ